MNDMAPLGKWGNTLEEEKKHHDNNNTRHCKVQRSRSCTHPSTLSFIHSFTPSFIHAFTVFTLLLLSMPIKDDKTLIHHNVFFSSLFPTSCVLMVKNMVRLNENAHDQEEKHKYTTKRPFNQNKWTVGNFDAYTR